MSMTAEQAGKALRELSKDITRVVPRSMNKVRKVAIADTKRGFRSQNPGRSIFTRKAGRGKPPLTVTGRTTRYSDSRKAYVTNVVIAGMAALIESGGKTKPPRSGKVYPVRKKALKFRSRGGVVYAASVNHPGSRIPRNPIAEKAVARTFLTLPRVIDEEVASAVRARGLG